MPNIRKILLLDGSKYEIGDKLFRENVPFILESLNYQSNFIGGLELPVIRIYVVESGSPYIDIPYHNVDSIFYS